MRPSHSAKEPVTRPLQLEFELDCAVFPTGLPACEGTDFVGAQSGGAEAKREDC